eukprot:6204898-Pleurochrysis_carterae.AAC.2
MSRISATNSESWSCVCRWRYGQRTRKASCTCREQGAAVLVHTLSAHAAARAALAWQRSRAPERQRRCADRAAPSACEELLHYQQRKRINLCECEGQRDGARARSERAAIKGDGVELTGPAIHTSTSSRTGVVGGRCVSPDVLAGACLNRLCWQTHPQANTPTGQYTTMRSSRLLLASCVPMLLATCVPMLFKSRFQSCVCRWWLS